ncbi:MAG TPA: hypothetical protein ENH82_05540 [bacterium]|nr:hypothetical protein [bacterium]
MSTALETQLAELVDIFRADNEKLKARNKVLVEALGNAIHMLDVRDEDIDELEQVLAKSKEE